MKNKYQSLLLPLIALVITLLVFWKLPVKGLIPFPGDLLAGRFFPWNTQTWEGYPTGVPYKEFISADTVRQTYPWRMIAIDQLKQGQLPWWNPYAFSGTPLLANLQSASFYPLNLLYWLLPHKFAWITQVLLQPILAICFTYLFARSLKLSTISALFAGTVFAFSGYMTVWLELNTVGHAAIWLPFNLWLVNSFFTALKSKQQISLLKFLALCIFGFTSSIFAGHIQTSLYVSVVSILYIFVQTARYLFQTKLNQRLISSSQLILFFVTIFGLTFLITAIQLIPALELLRQSPRSGVDATIFSQFLLPFKHLITFIIPNYFGNPATNNFFGAEYGEFMAYFGLSALVLALYSFSISKKSFTQIFLIFVFITSLIFASNNPVAHLPRLLQLPILSSSAASRILFLTQFSGSLLAAYGIDSVIKKTNSKFQSVLLGLISISLLIILGYTSLIRFTTTDTTQIAQTTVSLRNSVIPVGIFIIIVIFFFLHQKYVKLFQFRKYNLLGILFLFISIIDYSFFANKYLPFSQPQLAFAQTPPFSFIQSRGDLYRFFGDASASVTSNTWLPYRLYSVEGYDSLYLSRYGELLAASQNQGQLPSRIPRSDANLSTNDDNFIRQRLQDVLGVRYILHKVDFPQSDFEPDINAFSPDRYQLIWQQDKFQVYENTKALPRVMLVPTYEIISNQQAILDRFFDPQWDPRKSVIVETKPTTDLVMKLLPEFSSLDSNVIQADGKVEIIEYSPNKITLSVTTPATQILLISDTYYPDWQATLNNLSTTIFRANYTFRAIVVPEGNHQVTFVYQQQSLPAIWPLTN